IRRETLCGIAHRGRLAQNENAKSAGRFVDTEPDRPRIARDFLGKKPATEILVLHEEIFAVNFEALEELRIVAISAEPQRNLQHSEQEKLQKYQRKAEKPQPPSGGRYWRSSRLSTRRICILPSI